MHVGRSLRIDLVLRLAWIGWMAWRRVDPSRIPLTITDLCMPKKIHNTYQPEELVCTDGRNLGHSLWSNLALYRCESCFG